MDKIVHLQACGTFRAVFEIWIYHRPDHGAGDDDQADYDDGKDIGGCIAVRWRLLWGRRVSPLQQRHIAPHCPLCTPLCTALCTLCTCWLSVLCEHLQCPLVCTPPSQYVWTANCVLVFVIWTMFSEHPQQQQHQGGCETVSDILCNVCTCTSLLLFLCSVHIAQLSGG